MGVPTLKANLYGLRWAGISSILITADTLATRDGVQKQFILYNVSVVGVVTV